VQHEANRGLIIGINLFGNEEWFRANECLIGIGFELYLATHSAVGAGISARPKA
jgi:hypothetical protein